MKRSIHDVVSEFSSYFVLPFLIFLKNTIGNDKLLAGKELSENFFNSHNDINFSFR